MPNKENVTKEVRPKKERNPLVKYISILQWLPRYTRLDTISDIIAGITLGLTMIPQSIAYAALAGLTAQYGLYTALVGGFIYMFFGTIKEVSIGPTSLMALLALEFTRDMPVDFIVLLSFLAGCVELAMGLLKLGFLVDFISMPVTSGFTAAASVIIIISQLQGLLGLKYKSSSSVDNVVKLFQHVKDIHFSDTVLGFSSIVFLLLFRKLKDFDCSSSKGTGNVRRSKITQKTLWFLSIGRNASVVLFTSLIAVWLETTMGHSPFILSGKIKSGLPSIALPHFTSYANNQTYTFVDMCSHLGSGIIILPLVAVLANVAIAKAFARETAVDASQEMLTLGLCNIFGSFVQSMPACGAFTRSAVSSASGIRTPLANLYSGIMTLLALSFMTPYFYYIPRATLSAVLISAVIFMIDWKIVMILWKGNGRDKKDAFLVVGTFMACLVLNVEIGLLLGIVTNIIFLLYLLARPNIEVTRCKTDSDDEYLMIKPDIGLFYPAVDFLCNKVKEIAEQQGLGKLPLVLDCQRFKGVDYTATKGIERLLIDFERKKQQLLFMHVSLTVLNTIKGLVEIKPFQFIDDEAYIVDALYGYKMEISRSSTVPLFKQINEVNGMVERDPVIAEDKTEESELKEYLLTEHKIVTEEFETDAPLHRKGHSSNS